MKAFDKTRFFAIIECVLLMIVLQAMRRGAEWLTALVLPELPAKMMTMCAMLFLWMLSVAYIRLRRVPVPVFPKPFSRFYIIVTIIAAALMISSPSIYAVGLTAILELFYGSIVTPVFEETIFRGYFWERLRIAYPNEKAVYLLTTMLFTVWHIGYMLQQLDSCNWFAVGTKLAAALIYGLILGFVRSKCKNLYFPIVVHGIMNLLMI